MITPLQNILWLCCGNNLKESSDAKLSESDYFQSKAIWRRPCIRGMRIRVKDILDLLGAGLTSGEILTFQPDLEAEDILASIQFAARLVNYPVVLAA